MNYKHTHNSKQLPPATQFSQQ